MAKLFTFAAALTFCVASNVSLSARPVALAETFQVMAAGGANAVDVVEAKKKKKQDKPRRPSPCRMSDADDGTVQLCP